ncbi:MAG: glycoside hydrolase family 15 protein, partial [Thermodesulfovibrionales bacterium]|nr:glycoside hydrolase family 15 protein [Thermodesulfovibrionales bacterium]
MYKKISDYAIIGNLHSIALVGLDGSIDWLCLPHIDSPSVFGALLDDRKGGRFSVFPVDDWDSSARYLKNTNILRTSFRTRTGIMHLTDFMPVPLIEEDDMDAEHHELYRLIEIEKGTVDVRMIFEPRFDYAREIPSFDIGKRGVIAGGTDEVLALLVTKDVHFNTMEQRAEAEWKLSEGEKVWLYLHYGSKYAAEVDPERAEESLKNTRRYWENWSEKSETGVTVDLGRYQEMVNRSALALKLLYYNPAGTIAAAATTSLPEKTGGVRNWDYRYTWVRDTSFTLQALFNLGHLSETEGYLRWIEKLISRHGAEKLQIMYGLRGEEDLPENELMHLDGYKGSKPVRIGNGAAKQKQLDIYGELMDAAVKLSDYVGKISKDMWPFLQAICEYVVDHWRDKDYGIWEVRGGPYHFVYSKVMCWVALDRGLIIARRYGFPADRKKWEKVREEIKKEVLAKGFHEKKQAFVQHYETGALDSSNLLIPIFGFLPHNDPRVVSTVEAIMKELSNDGLLYRYKNEDGVEGGEGV